MEVGRRGLVVRRLTLVSLFCTDLRARFKQAAMLIMTPFFRHGPAKPLELSAIFYFGLEGSQGFLTLDTDEDESGLDSSSPIKLSGSTPELGEFGIRIEEAGGNAPIDPQDRHREEYKDRIGKTQFAGIRVPRGGAWRAKGESCRGAVVLGDASAKPVLSCTQRSSKPTSPRPCVMRWNDTAAKPSRHPP